MDLAHRQGKRSFGSFHGVVRHHAVALFARRAASANSCPCLLRKIFRFILVRLDLPYQATTGPSRVSERGVHVWQQVSGATSRLLRELREFKQPLSLHPLVSPGNYFRFTEIFLDDKVETGLLIPLSRPNRGATRDRHVRGAGCGGRGRCD